MGESVLQNGINMDEANTAFVFDTLMYSNALTDPDYEGMDIRSVVEQISVSGGLNEDESAAVAAVRTFLDTPKGQELHIGEYVLGDSSEFTSYNSEYRGAYEAVFYRDNGTSRDVFLAFKGTGDGRWFDNAVGLVTEYSPYQQKGLEVKVSGDIYDYHFRNEDHVLFGGHEYYYIRLNHIERAD